ncbi:MAG: hypothetical protein NC299_05160 [Lachnospiraceae bacterium]|nr:hypothetical protein [Ruminococcus sp.]MCM1274740.1 hypothetical protein [Lachnospiraceae bacterium]
MADNKFFELFNDIDEKYVKEALLPSDGLYEYSSISPKKRSVPLAILGAAACAALVFGVVGLSGLGGGVDRNGTVISGYDTGDAVYTLFGTPLPEGELEDFNCEAALESCREAFPEELSALLDGIEKPAAETYGRARTLAELAGWRVNADLIVTDKIKAKKDRAYIAVTVPSVDVVYPASTIRLYETGYSYESFCAAFREVFGERSADNMIMRSKYGFLGCGGQLYIAEGGGPVEEYGLVHTDYELVSSSDDEIVFNTVNYYDYADTELKKEIREPYKPENKDTYLNREGSRFVIASTNRLIMTDGVWKAEDICYDAGRQTLVRSFEDGVSRVTDKLELDGEPFPTDVHMDFEYGELLAEYTEELKKDGELTALLESIGDSEFTESYYRARTLADILGGKFPPDRAECMGPDTGAAISFYDEYNQVCGRYLELGYKYDSFFDELHEVFGNDTVNYMLGHGAYYDYNNELFYSPASYAESALLVHTEYELTARTDDMIAFETVCYHIRPEDFEPYAREQTYDPSDKEKYVVTRVNNLFVNVGGAWRAEEICFLGDKSSAAESAEVFTDGAGNTFKLSGDPLPESELNGFGYEETLEYCREKYARDEALTELLESLGKPELKELYYKARTLAEIVGMGAGVGYETFSANNAPGHERARITMLKDTTEPNYGVPEYSEPRFAEGQIFFETGMSYESFIGALQKTFSEESAERMTALYPFFYEHDGQLYCNFVTAGAPSNLVFTEYRLVENSADAVKFTTVNYYDTTDSGLGYDPERKEEYLVSEISNELRLVNGEWRAYEVCMLGDCSSRYGRMPAE